MTRQKVLPQFVVDRSSARPNRNRGQRCSSATSLATASTGTVLLPSQMLQIAGHVAIGQVVVEIMSLEVKEGLC